MSAVGKRQNCHEVGAGAGCYNPPAAGRFSIRGACLAEEIDTFYGHDKSVLLADTGHIFNDLHCGKQKSL
jgi:hypothetical protein